MKVVACVGLLNSKVFFCHWHVPQHMVQTIFKKKIVDLMVHANVTRIVGDVMFLKGIVTWTKRII
jgi:hypothetical protein